MTLPSSLSFLPTIFFVLEYPSCLGKHKYCVDSSTAKSKLSAIEGRPLKETLQGVRWNRFLHTVNYISCSQNSKILGV